METVPRERMYRITPMYPEDPRAPFYDPGAGEVAPMARLHVVRTRLVPRSCSEDVLLQMVADVQEDAQARDARQYHFLSFELLTHVIYWPLSPLLLLFLAL